MKIKYLLFLSVVTILLVSTFAYAPQANIIPSQGELTVPEIIDPTAPPTPFEQITNTTTPAPTIQPTPTYGYFSGGITTPKPIFQEPKTPGAVGSSQNVTADVWRAVANNAWQYFQPEVGVDSTYGLPGAGVGWPYFTDWDLGVYIQAVLDAKNIGLISEEGDWGTSSRLEKILSFLENRTLEPTSGLPYWWYEAAGGRPRPDLMGAGQSSINVADTGRLLVALQNLKSYNASWAGRIDNIVKTKTKYSTMLSEIRWVAGSVNVYDYFVASGFAAFWPEVAYVPTSILNNIMSAQKANVSGVQLPLATISCEPILLSMFDLKKDTTLTNLARQVYLAHEARYNETGFYTAFSEGNSGLYTFVYEWVVLPNGQKWILHDPNGNIVSISPIVYYKVAFSFLSLYNTAYSRNMAIWLENSTPKPIRGYNDGLDQDGRLVIEIGSNSNGLILSAARYALANNF